VSVAAADLAGYHDDIDAALRLAQSQVEAVATSGGWTSDATGAALDAVQAAYDHSTSWLGYASSFAVADIGESVQADVVQGFWQKLCAAAAGWTATGADQLRAAWAAAVAENEAWTTGDTSQTPLDVLGNAVDTVAEVTDAAKKAADEGTLLPMILIGAGAVLALVLVFNAPRGR
jgi:hypothetical protein